MLSIQNLSKVDLLYEMWKHQRAASFFGGGKGPDFDYEAAKDAVKGYVDYFCGRAIKTNLSEDTLSDAGDGTLEKIVQNMYKITSLFFFYANE
uniref:Uncharacterized protein n=1 Tax=viral metagenome TaxID=1070528 RepID=A0A6C0IDY5_9ZZZZ